MYAHFTDFEGAKAICLSRELWQSEFVAAVYAVNLETSRFVPGVQLTELGRPKNRDFAVIFDTNISPSGEDPEEVFWDLDELSIKRTKIVSARTVINMLKK